MVPISSFHAMCLVGKEQDEADTLSPKSHVLSSISQAPLHSVQGLVASSEQ